MGLRPRPRFITPQLIMRTDSHIHPRHNSKKFSTLPAISWKKKVQFRGPNGGCSSAHPLRNARRKGRQPSCSKMLPSFFLLPFIENFHLASAKSASQRKMPRALFFQNARPLFASICLRPPLDPPYFYFFF